MKIIKTEREAATNFIKKNAMAIKKAYQEIDNTDYEKVAPEFAPFNLKKIGQLGIVEEFTEKILVEVDKVRARKSVCQRCINFKNIVTFITEAEIAANQKENESIDRGYRGNQKKMSDPILGERKDCPDTLNGSENQYYRQCKEFDRIPNLKNFACSELDFDEISDDEIITLIESCRPPQKL